MVHFWLNCRVGTLEYITEFRVAVWALGLHKVRHHCLIVLFISPRTHSSVILANSYVYCGYPAAYNFHPNNSVDEFSRNLENTIIKSNNQRQTFYILGDFNINLLSDNRMTHAYLDSLTSLKVHCLTNKPTRFIHNCTPLVDQIYTNDNLHYSYPGLFCLDIRDHLPSFLLIKFSKNKQHAPIWRRCYKNLNVDSYLIDLEFSGC